MIYNRSHKPTPVLDSSASCTCNIEDSGRCRMHGLINSGGFLTRRALSNSELNIITLLTWGLSRFDIAACLKMAPSTVDNRIMKIRDLTKTSGELELIKWAFDNQIVALTLPRGEDWLMAGTNGRVYYQ